MNQVMPVREALHDVVNPDHSALLVIDVQNDFRTEDWATMLPRLESLIAAARNAGVFVVYIQNTVLADHLSSSSSEIARRKKLGMKSHVTVDGTWGERIVDELAPRPGDPVIRKHRMSSFFGTSLDRLLRNHGIEAVVCAGVATHGCVLNTAYSAVASDYYVVVAEDCVGSGRRDLHDTALFLMKNAMHDVVDSSQLISAWGARDG